MSFKFSKGLERIVLGIASSLIIAGTPFMYGKTVEAQTIMKPESNYSLYVGSPEKEVHKEYIIPIGKNNTKKIFLKAKKGKNRDSLEIIFGVDESEEAFGIKKEVIHLTPVDPVFSRLIMVYPTRTKIKKIEQEAYILPQHKFIQLSPLEETVISKKIIQWGENLIEGITPFFVINPVKDAKDHLIERSLKKDEKNYSEKAERMEEEFEEEYTFEKINFFTSDNIRHIEKTRKIKTTFDTRTLEGSAYITAFFKPAVGTNTSLEGRGSGGWVAINFLIQGEKLPSWIKKEETVFPGSVASVHKEHFNIPKIEEVMKNKRNNCFYVVGKDAPPDFPPPIIYYYNKEKIPSFMEATKSRKNFFKIQNIYLSLGKDLSKEKFDSKNSLVLREENSNRDYETLRNFYKICEKVEDGGADFFMN